MVNVWQEEWNRHHLFQLAFKKEHSLEFLGFNRCLHFCKIHSHIYIYIKLWLCSKFLLCKMAFLALHHWIPVAFQHKHTHFASKNIFPVAGMANSVGTENSGYCRHTVASVMKRFTLFPFSIASYLLLNCPLVATEHQILEFWKGCGDKTRVKTSINKEHTTGWNISTK